MNRAILRKNLLKVAVMAVLLWLLGNPGILRSSENSDLTGSWVDLKQSCKWARDEPQCTLSGKFTILNQGETASPTTSVKFYLSPNMAPTEGDFFLKEVIIKSLKPRQAKILTLKINLPAGEYASDVYALALITGGEEPNVVVWGPVTSGKEYFPFGLGDTWEFQGKISENGNPATSYVNTLMITGNILINGVTTTVFTESNPTNSGTSTEEYLVKDSQGITYWGSNEETGFLPSQMAPLKEVYFPLQLDSNFKQSFKRVDLGEDLDGDSVNETTDVTYKITVAGFEEVIVPAGAFPKSVRIETNATLTVTLSGNHRKVTVKATQTEWFALGIGPVKRIFLAEAKSAGETVSEEVIEELTAFYVGGRGKGILHTTIANGVAKPISDYDTPGRTAIGSDGMNFLVAFAAELWSPPGLYGVIESERGIVLKSFLISDSITSYPGRECGTWPFNSTAPAIAFDGTNYLIVFQRCGKILGIRISPSGAA